jgi:hypothetical protein
LQKISEKFTCKLAMGLLYSWVIIFADKIF